MIGKERKLQMIDSSPTHLTYPSGRVRAVLVVQWISDDRAVTHLLTARPRSQLQQLEGGGFRTFGHRDLNMPIGFSSLGEHDGRYRHREIVNREF